MGNYIRRRRIISRELLKQWKRLTRKGDVNKIVEITGKTKPTIINALSYGYVQQQEIIDAINKFFKDRLEEENRIAEELLKQSQK